MDPAILLALGAAGYVITRGDDGDGADSRPRVTRGLRQLAAAQRRGAGERLTYVPSRPAAQPFDPGLQESGNRDDTAPGTSASLSEVAESTRELLRAKIEKAIEDGAVELITDIERELAEKYGIRLDIRKVKFEDIEAAIAAAAVPGCQYAPKVCVWASHNLDPMNLILEKVTGKKLHEWANLGIDEVKKQAKKALDEIGQAFEDAWDYVNPF